MLDTQEIQRLRQSSGDSATYNQLLSDPEFRAKVDRVQQANPDMTPFEKLKFPSAMIDIHLGVNRKTTPTMEQTASMIDSGMQRQEKGAFKSAIEDPLSFAGQTIKNVLPSTGRLIGGAFNAVTSPIRTGKTLFQLGVGGAANTIESIASLAGVKNPEQIFDLGSEEVANAVGDFYVQRYGSLDAAASTLRDDPAGFLSDLGAVVTGVGGAIKGGATAVGSVTGSATRASSSMSALGKGVRAAQSVGGSMIKTGINMEPLVITGRGVMMVGRGVRAGAQAVGPTASVERLLDSSMKLHPNQINNFTKLTGETPAQFLVRKGILSGGEASVDAEKGVTLGGRTIFGRTKAGIVDDLEKVKSTAYTTVRKELGSVKQTYDLIDEAPKAYAALSEIEATAAQYGLMDELNFVRGLKDKSRVSLIEMNQLKERMDDLYNLYSKSNEPTASLVAERLRRVRSGLREFIEQEADVRGIADVGMLNRDVQLSSELLNNIERASLTGMGRNVISLNDALFGIGTLGLTGDFFTTAGVVIGRRILESAPFKTTLAKYLNRLTESEIKSLLDITKKGAKHTKETKQLVRKVVSQTADDIRNQRIGEQEISSANAARPIPPQPSLLAQPEAQVQPPVGTMESSPTTLPEQSSVVNPSSMVGPNDPTNNGNLPF